ncbi:MAG: hypothetical protein A2928_00130 [Candidatus Taylorbacteria bacterium RIFCSPLOWO2_01_FULL_45_15b]|uniref:UDP-N-acetylglucosamine 2-epimerase domain-containing protein n=1 Tax=Candidatus Taylorbacteria bacterium RIFCSPLOWO2_01_FULL_45_15b TaxID=1802319 RepID=A0A1G2NAV0_9BACT|nr:MAG: hypothetical protein A2928_00130 [Candidatus Taylorbacteria bacterium RIFCSPLOWO2_01_FULL_45_15b]
MGQKKTVFLFIPNYVYSSDFLHTTYIQHLSSLCNVIIFAPPDLLNGGNYWQGPNLTYIEWNLQHPRFWIVFGKLLRYSLIRRFDTEPVVIRNRRKGMRDWKRKVLRTISYLLPPFLLQPDVFTAIETFLLPRSKKFGEYVSKYKPSLILTPTPGFTHFDAEAIVTAKKFDVPTVAVNFSWDNLYNGGIHFRRTDYLIVWNELIKDTAVKEYKYPPDSVFVSGIIRFDRYFISDPKELSREEFLMQKGLNPQEKTILLTTVTKGNYQDEHLLLGELIKYRANGAFQGFPNILVRMHPKEEFQKFEAYKKTAIKNLRVEKAGNERLAEIGSTTELDEEDLRNLKHTLTYSDVAINYLSTISLEAIIFDKPVININYPEQYHEGYTFRHYKPLVDLGAVRLAYSPDELVKWVNKFISDPSLDDANRHRVKNLFIKYTDGMSHKRNAAFILLLLEENSQ